MLFLYNFGIWLYTALILAASIKSSKAKQWVKGRSQIIKRIESEVQPGKDLIWFHFASLGEFEQGRPVLENIRQVKSDYRILVTFFSPSGYEIKKSTPLADHVFYLPADTRENAEAFIRAIKPAMAIFTKYEYWYHYFHTLKKKQIPLYIVSGIFRESQLFFKWYGGLHRKILSCVTHFFVQNKNSVELLNTLGISNVSLSGDTRFDRVFQNQQNVKPMPEIENFCAGKPVFICGSTWLDDEKLLSDLPAILPDWKFIVAPHEIGESRIRELETLFTESMKFSGLETRHSLPNTVIIDNIGMLSTLYQYGDIAYIGGGFGAGIHNTLEAAAFGLPVIFGPKFEKFNEATELIRACAAFSVNNSAELQQIVQQLNDTDYRLKAGQKAKAYVKANTGATALIINHIFGLSSDGDKEIFKSNN